MTTTDPVKKYLSEIGRRGGLSRSKAKVAAVRRNVKIASAAHVLSARAKREGK